PGPVRHRPPRRLWRDRSAARARLAARRRRAADPERARPRVGRRDRSVAVLRLGPRRLAGLRAAMSPELEAAELHINWRGPLASCNYDCDYCPFAKHVSSREELAADQAAL